MKKFVLMIAAVTLSTGALFAQEMKDKKMSKMHHSMSHKMKDCVMMHDGKMMVMKDGKTMDMAENMTLKNGAVVMSDGNVKMKDGKTMMLKDGDCMYMDGTKEKMKDMKMDKMDKKMK